MRNQRILLASVCAVGLVAGGGTALAAASSGPVSGGVITGCYTNAAVYGTHVIVLQDAGSTCPKGTTAVTWNQTGPAGPAGQTGPAGPAGPAGASGPAGAIGATGAQGPAGADGKAVLNGTGAPGATVGDDGDFYIDTAADVLYGPKANGAWPMPGTSLVGPAGSAGPQGPAGASSLDALNGTVCNTGNSNPGALSVSYGNQGSVTLTCVPTQLYTLTVSVAAGDGFDSIVSSPAGIDCGPAVAESVCSAQFPAGYTVTLTGQADRVDVLDGWSGPASSGPVGACPAQVNVTHPYTEFGQPGLASSLDNTCPVTMSADTSVAASFAGVMLVTSQTASDNVNFVPDPGGPECSSAQPNCKGTDLSPGAGTNPLVTDVIPYGTSVSVTDEQGNGVSFGGYACSVAAGATVTATECDFTMAPGDAHGIDEPALAISGP